MKTSQALLLWMFCAFAAASEAPHVTAFVDVNVVPMDQDHVLSHQTVVVQGDRIATIGAAARVAVPADARRVEGHGTAYLLPGLADMHTHVDSGEDAALFLAYGVTTVLQMGGDSKVVPIRQLRSALAQSAASPQVYFAFMIDGPTPLSGGWPVHSVEQARFAVRVAKERDYDFIKLYNGPAVEEFDAIVDEAHKVGLAVIGHGVRSVGLPAGLFRGQVMVAHAEEFYYTAFGMRPDYAGIAPVVEQTFQSGAYVTANLSAFDAIARQWGHPAVRDGFLTDPLLAYMSPYSRLIWAQQRRDYTQNKGEMQTPLAFLKRFVGALANRGVPLLAGTDAPVIPGLVPGYSINEEIRLLVESGLTPYQALVAATRAPGEFIAKYVPAAPRFGVVAAGSRADLVLVETNPLQSLDSLKAPLGVMAAGSWKTREELHAILEANRQRLETLSKDAFRQSSKSPHRGGVPLCSCQG